MPVTAKVVVTAQDRYVCLKLPPTGCSRCAQGISVGGATELRRRRRSATRILLETHATGTWYFSVRLRRGYANQKSRGTSAAPTRCDQIVLIRNADVWQMAKFVVVVQAVADDECIGDFEAIVIRRQVHLRAIAFPE